MTQIGILGAAAVQDDGVRAAQALGWTVHVLAARPDGPAAESADVFVPIDFSDRDAVVRYAQAHALDCRGGLQPKAGDAPSPRRHPGQRPGTGGEH